MKIHGIILLTSILILSSLFSFSQIERDKQMYMAPHFLDTIATHKIVAIVPFRITISYKRMPKGFDNEANKAEELKQGFNMQQGMFTYLLRKADKYSVSFQDVERTNALLRKFKMLDNIDEILPDSICKILGVDAVIKSTYSYEKTGSEAGAIAKTVLLGFGGSTGSGSLTMQINNGSDGLLLWRFFKSMNEGAFTSGDELMIRMMKKVARNFPYEK